MKIDTEKRAVSLGIRIGTVFLLATALIFVVAYYVLSQNVQGLLTDYTLKLVESLSHQGVKLVENELESGRKEVSILAGSLQLPDLPAVGENMLRIVYVSETGTVSSDGRVRDLRARQDIQSAYQGETAVYGPYYNEEGEFVVCYSSPVKKEGQIVGVLSIEKDGYRFCDLIENIRFIDSGESYILNAEGTDIAVSNRDHIEWVTSEYNSQELYETYGDPETGSILEVELKALNGETGTGTYYWEDGLVYLVYEPIPSIGWSLLSGLREEEIAAMTQSAFFATLSRGPTLGICLAVFLLLTAVIVYWIVSSMKKNAEINQKLEIIANHDTLTGLLNRRYLESSLSEQWRFPVKVPSQAAVFMMDIDNFKQYNDFYGHPQGDECLCRVADIFKHVLDHCGGSVMRYGGEEFVAAVFQMDQPRALETGREICRLVEAEQLPNGGGGVVTVSVGVCHAASTLDVSLYDCIQIADKALYQAKRDGKNRAVLLLGLPTSKECAAV